MHRWNSLKSQNNKHPCELSKIITKNYTSKNDHFHSNMSTFIRLIITETQSNWCGMEAWCCDVSITPTSLARILVYNATTHELLCCVGVGRSDCAEIMVLKTR